MNQANEVLWQRRRIVRLFVAFAILSAVLVNILEAVESSGGDDGVLDVALYGTILVAAVTFALIFAVPRLLGRFTPEGHVTTGFLIMVGGLAVMIPIAFGRACRGLWLLFGGFAGVNPTAPLSSFGVMNQWDTFAYSWLFDSFTFNASQVFDWMPTPIHPTVWWSGLLVVLFSIVADTVVFAGVVNVFRVIPRH